jgi:hypothetical protein
MAQNVSHDSVTCPSLILERTAMKKDIVMQLACGQSTHNWHGAVMLLRLREAIMSETHHVRGRSN